VEHPGPGSSASTCFYREHIAQATGARFPCQSVGASEEHFRLCSEHWPPCPCSHLNIDLGCLPSPILGAAAPRETRKAPRARPQPRNAVLTHVVLTHRPQTNQYQLAPPSERLQSPGMTPLRPPRCRCPLHFSVEFLIWECSLIVNLRKRSKTFKNTTDTQISGTSSPGQGPRKKRNIHTYTRISAG